MADKTRGERTVQLFAKVIANPNKKFTINDLTEALEIPENEKRNVQRDMRFLSEMDGGRYIQAESVGRTFYYSSALQNADRLLFPNFENTMLHFVFLRRIANIFTRPRAKSLHSCWNASKTVCRHAKRNLFSNLAKN